MDTEREASDVFGLLADASRLDILRTVARAQHKERRTGVATLSFSDIYDRVGVDNTSKLSYHLGELTGTFLRKHDDGYAFTHAGEQLVRFVLAGNYREPEDFGVIETDGACLYCSESALRASLEEQYFLIRCSTCDRPAFSYRIRPSTVRSHAGEELIEAVVREQAADFLKMRRGVCPDCGGRIDTEVIPAEDEAVPDEAAASFATLSECKECLRFLSLPVSHAAAYHPDSITFHWEHGVDVMGTGVWEFHRYLHDGRWSAESTDAADEAYLVELDRDTATLRLFLDEHATVTRSERVRRRGRR